MLHPDQLIGARYRIESELGVGGMGIVYRANDEQTATPVAVKLLKREAVHRDPNLMARFEREGEALRQLNHPNIVKMLAALEQDDNHYLVMEYMGGGDLGHLLKDSSGLPLTRVLDIALDVADALTRAHRLKIIHRDLKPANVLLADDGTPRLTDFGVAHLGEAERVTDTGMAIGTLDYISPEMLNGDDIDARTDIWSFGVMLYEMLCGQRPFSGPSVTAILTAILTHPTPDLESARPDLPVALVDLVYRMLEKDRNTRISSTRLVGAELEAILQNILGDETPGSDTPLRIMAKGSRFNTPTPFTPDNHKHNLPVQTMAFIGRETEVNDLKGFVQDPDIRQITILAPGGMGKTRLSLEVAQQTMRHFKDGVYFVQLAPLLSSEYIVPTIADAIGYQLQQDERDDLQQLTDYLRAKKMLLIMDNFEHVLDGATILSQLLRAAPDVKFMVTSRERLRLQEETVYRIDGMPIPTDDKAHPVTDTAVALEFSAVQLFMQSAQRAQPGFKLEPEDVAYVTRICRAVQGLPLGIELAAAWVGMLTLPEIAEEIEQGLDLLETDMQNVPERHRSIRAVFAHSWQLMSAEEQAIFQQMAIFRGSFTRQAAQVVTGASLRTLTTFLNKSHLRRDPDSGRYSIHELLRQYAEEQLIATGDVVAVRDKHSAYYLGWLASLQKDIYGGKQLDIVTHIEQDLENVRLAWIWAAEQSQYEALAKAIDVMWRYKDIRGLQITGEALFVKTVGILEKQPATQQRDILLLHLNLNRLDFAGTLQNKPLIKHLAGEVKRLYDIVKHDTPTMIEADYQYALGHLQMDVSVSKKRDQCREHLKQALALYEQLGLTGKMALTLRQLGNSYWYGVKFDDASHSEQAMHYLQRGYDIAKQHDDIFAQALLLMNIGTMRQYQSDKEGAKEAYLGSLQLRKQLGNKIAISGALFNLAQLLRTTHKDSDMAQARAYLADSLALRREIGSPFSIMMVLQHYGWFAYEHGDHETARQAMQEVLELSQRYEMPNWNSAALYGLGNILTEEGNYHEAEQIFKEAAEMLRHDENTFDLAANRRACATVQMLQGHYQLAEDNLKQALDIYTTYQAEEGAEAHSISYRKEWANWHNEASYLAYLQRDYGKAYDYAHQALTLIADIDPEQLGMYEHITKRLNLAVVCIADARMDEAHSWLQQSLTMTQETSIAYLHIHFIAVYALFISAQDPAEAVALARFVQQHRNQQAIPRHLAQEVLDICQSSLTQQAMSAALADGTQRQMDSILQTIAAAIAPPDTATIQDMK